MIPTDKTLWDNSSIKNVFLMTEFIEDSEQYLRTLDLSCTMSYSVDDPISIGTQVEGPHTRESNDNIICVFLFKP